MKKISEIKGEEAIDILAELIDPIGEIAADKDFIELARGGERTGAVKKALKDHKKSVITILALLDGEDPATYQPSLVSLPMKLLELLNDPDLQLLFE